MAPGMNGQLASAILNQDREKDIAQLYMQDRLRNASFEILDSIPLDTAQSENSPMILDFPFKTLWVYDATDNDVTVYLKVDTRDGGQKAIPLKKNVVFSDDFSFARAYLHWSAQSGKTASIAFSSRGRFQAGSLISQISGGVTLLDGTALTWPAPQIALAAATATLIRAASASRKCLHFVNDDAANIWVGGSTVTNAGATKGRLVVPGESFYWRNQAALYGYSVAGCTLTLMEET